MLRPSRRTLSLLCTVCLSAIVVGPAAVAAPPSLMRLFGKAKPIDKADSYVLTEEDGPWLLLATTFIGEDAKEDAQAAAIEIRSKLRLPAFIYKEDFNFTGTVDRDASTGRRMRYANPHQYEAYAVLVGEYDTVNHESIDTDLEKLKTAQLDVFQKEALESDESDAANPASMIKSFGQKLFKSAKGRSRNPMSTAFLTRNPLLPEDFFQQPEVDSFVQELNEGMKYSLLENDGKFTVVVRTFGACGTIEGAKNSDKFKPSAERMDQFARQADKMVKALRKQGHEAYQYHDRDSSVVTIGSFESLGRELPNGQFEYAPEIRRVMNEFSALNSQNSRSINGGQAFMANHVAMIPFDVQPAPIAVPKASKRSLYSALR
ncbi:hypothetical protein LOC67_15940 [Stieleria sp. JC731]|uniref:hypothetical protein n=1 Tax=Pirellulaceae TaxID=2691357 RepID=UPI001E4DF854|nr:hypothetical protein [Stieleria sp. JC731]MCC9602054.1 hypothetical protein [Stieleria sp. JC731]